MTSILASYIISRLFNHILNWSFLSHILISENIQLMWVICISIVVRYRFKRIQWTWRQLPLRFHLFLIYWFWRLIRLVMLIVLLILIMMCIYITIDSLFVISRRRSTAFLKNVNRRLSLLITQSLTMLLTYPIIISHILSILHSIASWWYQIISLIISIFYYTNYLLLRVLTLNNYLLLLLLLIVFLFKIWKPSVGTKLVSSLQHVNWKNHFFFLGITKSHQHKRRATK